MAGVGWSQGSAGALAGEVDRLGDTHSLSAPLFRERVEQWVRALGWEVERDIARRLLIATRGAETIAITCDRKTPRERSLNALRNFHGTGALALVREATTKPRAMAATRPHRREKAA
jgi:hypothetical protein